MINTEMFEMDYGIRNMGLGGESLFWLFCLITVILKYMDMHCCLNKFSTKTEILIPVQIMKIPLISITKYDG